MRIGKKIDAYIFPEPRLGVAKNILAWLRDLVLITMVACSLLALLVGTFIYALFPSIVDAIATFIKQEKIYLLTLLNQIIESDRGMREPK